MIVLAKLREKLSEATEDDQSKRWRESYSV